MMKPGLGKGLGQLMNGDRAAGSAPPKAGMGRGLNKLVQNEPAPVELPAPAKKILLPTWFFFAADILLLAFAVAICFDAPKPLDLGSILFCGVSVTLGAVLSVIGVWRAA